MKSKKLLIIGFIAVVAVAATLFFLTQKKDTKITDGGAFEISFNKQGTLAFLSAQNNDTLSVIDIEVADNNQRRARGLMYRKSLPADAGMLFVFDEEEIQGFWMKNTYIPLDMLFVNADNEIITIHTNTAPLKEWNYASTRPALYVVEVNAGYCAQKQITEGDKIIFELSSH
ncbi:MAG: DUF192 domain-containing protein [Petrimonas sp.]|jgi:hypothetical protein|nr:DUF192 domain-containing protein [Petrimonas sp.]NLU30807.1 DUF192 domain-containing protein [Bacteroidales bacterium]BBD45407.1 Hypothetical protein PEIBARAKI_5400 [Petrimonas sp. IBARAKI]HAC73192.1 DUF192 domain-containing protein [Porphyromonadaceae bacterium]MDD3541717.1 DUF192 domain-containing protein [Petrimonas sp.]